MRGVRDHHLGPRSTLGGVPRTHQQQTGELSRSAGSGLERRGRHPGDLAENLFQLHEQLEPSLDATIRCSGVHIGQARQRCNSVAELGVVLHRARSERVRPQVDRVLPVGEPREMTDQVALRYFCQSDRRFAAVQFGNELFRRELGHTR